MSPSTVTVLGATGSVGLSTLDVLGRHPERFQVHGLSAYSRMDELAALCRLHRPRVAVVPDAEAAARLRAALGSDASCEIAFGEAALAAIATDSEVDQVMAAIVGAAGLPPTLAAARAGKRVLLANKEALVMAGPVFMDAVRSAGATLLPIDSEHNAIFQCLPVGYRTGRAPEGVRRLLLTASGGPFRARDPASLAQVTPDEACAHPNWSMGRKISVDSATMMNKGLELIEAAWLFGLPPALIDIVIHPESVIHSMVEYVDGSVLAQLGEPDMRTPIANGLAWPERVEAGVAGLDLIGRGSLTFTAPDPERFPALALAQAAAAAGGVVPAILNAANEVAVEAFLAARIGYLDIPAIIATTLDAGLDGDAGSLAGVLDVDARARRHAQAQLTRMAG